MSGWSWTFGYGRMNKPDEFYYVRVSTGPWTGGSRAQFIVRLSLISSACKHFAREGFFQGNFDSDEAFFEVFGRPDRVFPDPESQNFHIWRYDRCSDGPILLHSSWVEKGHTFSASDIFTVKGKWSSLFNERIRHRKLRVVVE